MTWLIGRDGVAHWERWGCSLGEMGWRCSMGEMPLLIGRDAVAHWERWCCSLGEMPLLIGRDGIARWERFGLSEELVNIFCYPFLRPHNFQYLEDLAKLLVTHCKLEYAWRGGGKNSFPACLFFQLENFKMSCVERFLDIIFYNFTQQKVFKYFFHHV